MILPRVSVDVDKARQNRKAAPVDFELYDRTGDEITLDEVERITI